MGNRRGRDMGGALMRVSASVRVEGGLLCAALARSRRAYGRDARSESKGGGGKALHEQRIVLHHGEQVRRFAWRQKADVQIRKVKVELAVEVSEDCAYDGPYPAKWAASVCVDCGRSLSVVHGSPESGRDE